VVATTIVIDPLTAVSIDISGYGELAGVPPLRLAVGGPAALVALSGVLLSHALSDMHHKPRSSAAPAAVTDDTPHSNQLRHATSA
jgi:hypothetical protein